MLNSRHAANELNVAENTETACNNDKEQHEAKVVEKASGVLLRLPG